MKSKKTITIIGLGLIGGSLGLRFKQKTQHTVIGWSLHQKTRISALHRGAIDIMSKSLPEAVKKADIIMLATPITQIPAIFQTIAKHCRPNTIISDVTSVKQPVVQMAKEILPNHQNFVPGHPMAGKEVSGITHADPALFNDKPWILTPDSSTNPQALATMESLLHQLLITPIHMSAKKHDGAVARISHLPSVLAPLLVETIDDDNRQFLQKLISSGFADMTRLASNATLTMEMCQHNQKELLSSLQLFDQKLHRFQELLKKNDLQKIQHILLSAQKHRSSML